jgi:hypothetical protein
MYDSEGKCAFVHVPSFRMRSETRVPDAIRKSGQTGVQFSPPVRVQMPFVS